MIRNMYLFTKSRTECTTLFCGHCSLIHIKFIENTSNISMDRRQRTSVTKLA